ncbi:CbtB domain-containing protein [Yoonia sp. 208BN28-4]|uniref:CbtB domain-containing protein n=1 Tax=Yoonia sp. 208BN28-4 TaxID=3126505 RepID=UPI0030A97545
MTKNATTRAATLPKTSSATTTLSILAAAVIGLGIISVAGHVQAATLHDAAHDVRHATGFPCH